MMHGASIHKDNGISVVHVAVKQGLLITVNYRLVYCHLV